MLHKLLKEKSLHKEQLVTKPAVDKDCKESRALHLDLKEQLIIMLDWDNTIISSADFAYEIHEKTAKELEKQGIKLLTKIPLVPTKKKEDVLKELFGEENISKVLPVFKKYFDQLFKPQELKMLSGAKELLEKLNHANISVAIISNSTKSSIEKYLDLKKINRNKIIIVGADSTIYAKPCVEPALLALEKLDVLPTQTIKILMIGDGIESDMIFSRNINEYLKKLNKNSTCTGILFNSLLSGEAIFNSAQIEKFIEEESSSNPDRKPTQFNRYVAHGYCGIFKHVRDAIISNLVTSDSIDEQRKKLKHVSLR